MADRERVAGWALFAGMNSDHQDVVEFTPDPDVEPDNHDGRYVLVPEEALALFEGDERLGMPTPWQGSEAVAKNLDLAFEGDEEPVEAPETLYFDDGGDLTAWSYYGRINAEGAWEEVGVASPSDPEIPEALAEDAPWGWSVFEGEVFKLTEEQAASEEFFDPYHGRLEPGTEWWRGHLRPATAAEVCAFFRLSRPSPTEGAHAFIRSLVIEGDDTEEWLDRDDFGPDYGDKPDEAYRGGVSDERNRVSQRARDFLAGSPTEGAEVERLRAALMDQIRNSAHAAGERPDVIALWERDGTLVEKYAAPSARRALNQEEGG